MGRKGVFESVVDVINAMAKPIYVWATRWEFWAIIGGIVVVVFLAFIVVPGLKALISSVFNYAARHR